MRNLLLTVAAAALLGSATQVGAVLVPIPGFSDDFSTPQATSTNNAVSGFDTGTTLMTSNGPRLIQTDILSNTAPGDARGRTAILNGAFSFSTDDGVNGLGFLTYSFNTPVSLTLSPVFVFTFLGNDDNGALHINVTDTVGNTSTTNFAIPSFPAGTGPVTLAVPANLVGVNSASVSKLVFSFGGTPSEDLSIDAIRAVPEPGTLGLLTVLGSLTGAGLLARRRRA